MACTCRRKSTAFSKAWNIVSKPISTAAPNEVAFFDRLSASWWQPNGEFAYLHRMNPARFAFLRRRLQQRQLRNLPPLFLQNMSVLDVGCGGGLFAEGCARLGAKTTGIDASALNIRVAQAHSAQDRSLDGRLVYRAIAAEDLEKGQALYDIVCSMDVLEHVNEPTFFLKTLASLVKPGGHLFLSTISRTLLAKYLTITIAESSTFGIVSPGTHDFSKYIRPPELANFIAQGLGWPVEHMETSGVNYMPIAGFWRLGRSRIGHEVLQRAAIDQQSLSLCHRPGLQDDDEHKEDCSGWCVDFGFSTSTGRLTAGQIAFYYAFKALMARMDPSRAKSDEAKTRSKTVLSRLGIQDLELSEHECVIAAEVIHPSDINVQFQDVGGLDHIIDSLRESVIYPLVYPEVFQSAAGLYKAPQGCLLFGPPGCGKTLLAKALAKESNATFINMKASVLQDKWYGESNKLVAALFSLARKLQPSIIFIDEIDSFMRERSRTDHEVSATIKAEFMSSWDGLTTSEDTRIMVLGATNRPNDIDAAILRRLPKRFPVRLPTISQRKSILSLMLRDVSLEPNFDLDALARQSEGLSGSDLKELCRNAAGAPVREHFKQLSQFNGAPFPRAQVQLRPLTLDDFFSPAPTREKFTVLEDAIDNLD